MAYYIHFNRNTELISAFSIRYIYCISLAAASVLVALMLLAPFDHTFRHFTVDFLLSVAWFIAFVFLLIEFQHTDCNQNTKQFGSIALGGGCNTKRAAYGFAFLSGCFWAVTFVVGVWVTMRERKLKNKKSPSTA